MEFYAVRTENAECKLRLINVSIPSGIMDLSFFVANIRYGLSALAFEEGM